jgi:alpha-tubulin suppressor-like RCC1 family protein
MFRSGYCVFGASLLAAVAAGAAACTPEPTGQQQSGGAAGVGPQASGGAGGGHGGASSGGAAESTGGTPDTKLAAKGIAAGESHACALLVDGRVRCWGWNIDGQLGDGTATTSHVPVAVSGITDAVAVAAGGVHSCALLGGGTVRCWGDNFDPPGINPAEECQPSQIYPCGVVPATVPVTVSELNNPTAISAGYFQNCALLPAGTVQCWGINSAGVLGSPTSVSRSKVPLDVSGVTNAAAIATGEAVSCAALTDGTVKCWGDNHYGSLGNGSTVSFSSVPVTVNGITDAVMVTSGGSHSCALHANGMAACWGINWWNQLGDGAGAEGVSSPNPVGVEGTTDAIMLAAGGANTCALLRDRTLKCWGYGFHGELGNGTNPYRSGPVTVSGLANVIAFAVGAGHSCAVLSGGTVRCWGSNERGQLGDGTTLSSSVPVTVVGF